MNYHNKLFRHGDVDGIPIELTSLKTIPPEAKPNGRILAYGEATNHHHELEGNGQVLLLEKPITVQISGEQIQVEKFLHVEETAQLTHQEHETRLIQPGDYVILGERQYNPFDEEIRKVMD